MNGQLIQGSKLEGQKFAVGQKVYVAKDLGKTMSHFRSDQEATIAYSYGQMYGGDTDDYMVTFKDGSNGGWYNERNLTAIKYSTLDKIRKIFKSLKECGVVIIDTVRNKGV